MIDYKYFVRLNVVPDVKKTGEEKVHNLCIEIFTDFFSQCIE